ncbi:YceI family protein [Frigidibacter sp. MR17.24]|uniref:YceI family protein n=1 Tax=Frigidibacter sp. MR17.24 TaxID=3127345 RepID=UPI0030131B7D
MTFRTFAAGAALSLAAFAGTAALAAPEKYVLDNTHTQIVFHYNHLGFSTGFGMFAGFDGEIMFDQDEPANSSVTVSFPVTSLITGIDARTEHFLSADFFGKSDDPTVTFKSTAIEVTGEDTANITGDLTLNGITKPVVLDAKLNQVGNHPMANKPWAGFDATTTVKRSDFDLGMFAPYVGDDVTIEISIEAMKAE